MYSFRDIYVYVMYYVYVTSGPSLLIESTDSMISTLMRVRSSTQGDAGSGADNVARLVEHYRRQLFSRRSFRSTRRFVRSAGGTPLVA